MKSLSHAPVDQPSKPSRKQRTRFSCRSYVERLFKPGTPSMHGIKSIDELPVGSLAVATCRESSPKQSDALPHQTCFVTARVESRGSKCIAIVSQIASCHPDSIDGKEEHNLYPLMLAVHDAKQLGATAIVVESMTRVIRQDCWRASGPCLKLQPTDDDLREVITILDGIQLFTVAHPDASQNEQRKLAGDRRAAVSPYKRGRKPKRPNAGWTADEQIEQIVAMFGEGVSKQRIAKLLGMPRSTVRDIIDRNS